MEMQRVGKAPFGNLGQNSLGVIIIYQGSVPRLDHIITREAGNLKVSLELGGNAVHILTNSADLEYTVRRWRFIGRHFGKLGGSRFGYFSTFQEEFLVLGWVILIGVWRIFFGPGETQGFTGWFTPY